MISQFFSLIQRSHVLSGEMILLVDCFFWNSYIKSKMDGIWLHSCSKCFEFNHNLPSPLIQCSNNLSSGVMFEWCRPPINFDPQFMVVLDSWPKAPLMDGLHRHGNSAVPS